MENKSSGFPFVIVIFIVVVIIGAFFILKSSGPNTPASGTAQPSQASSPSLPDVSQMSKVSFANRAAEAGIDFKMGFLTNEQGENFRINLYDHGCGAVIGDYDGDGSDDVLFLNQLGGNALYRNKGKGTFENVTTKAGPIALADRICVGGTFSDYDNDGDQDLFITSTRGGNVLFQNDGKGHFADMTDKAGLKHLGHSQTAAFVDTDRDGDLDLLVTNTAKWTQQRFDQQYRYFPGQGTSLWDLISSPKEYNIFYRNNGDGTFTEATDQAGLKGQGWGGDIAICDYDEDGDIDILVTNMFGLSQLYQNDGKGVFKDVTLQTLKKTTWGAIGSRFFDFNNDGRLDLMIADMHSDMWMPYTYDLRQIVDTKKYDYVMGPLYLKNDQYKEMEVKFRDAFNIQYKKVLFGNSLFKNLGGGNFEEMSGRAGMETFWPWGIAEGDFDLDGYQDVFLPAGMGYPFQAWQNYLMMNNGNETFTDRAREAGIDPPPGGKYLTTKIKGKPMPRSSRCAATGDFDNDGLLDIMVNNFNDHPYYLKNQSPKGRFVKFKLRGTVSNRDAIGAIVRLHRGTKVKARMVSSASGYLSQSSKTLHFGLGDWDKIDRAEILWPSGIRQTIETPALNRLLQVTEKEPK